MEMNMTTEEKLGQLIEGLKLRELMILNRIVVERIRLMQKATTLVALSQFRVGDRVSWISKDGNRFVGEIIRINHKTVSIRVSEGGYWNVSPQLLQKEL
jgi:hypothetical protein